MYRRDLLRFTAVVVAAVVLGRLIGGTPWLIAAGVTGYAAWQHRNLARLLRWIRNRKRYDAPEVDGILADVCREIDFLRERHKKRKKKLGQYLKQFQEATMALPDAVVVLDGDFQVQWANAAAARYLGIKWPDDLNQRLTNLLRVPELREFLAERRADLSTEIAAPTEPETHLSVRIAPYGKNQWLFVARDVTELHQLNQVRSDFVANVSHELRTPITVFKGYLEAMTASEDELPERWASALGQMHAHVERMHSTIEELLLLSRLERSAQIGHAESVDVERLLGDIHLEAQALGKDKAQLFSLEIDGDLTLLGDPAELYSAFSNIVFNAVNYTQARGVIGIHWYADESGAHLAVSDNGPGIASEHIPRLTERFYRTDASRSRQFGGTGLGLAIVKHVMQRHGGTLSIASEVGKGSTFTCHFPPDRVEQPRASLSSASS